jgi:hypothetical protein
VAAPTGRRPRWWNEACRELGACDPLLQTLIARHPPMRIGSRGDVSARLDLDEDEDAPAPGDEVDLAARKPQPARQDRIALEAEQPGTKVRGKWARAILCWFNGNSWVCISMIVDLAEDCIAFFVCFAAVGHPSHSIRSSMLMGRRGFRDVSGALICFRMQCLFNLVHLLALHRMPCFGFSVLVII